MILDIVKPSLACAPGIASKRCVTLLACGLAATGLWLTVGNGARANFVFIVPDATRSAPVILSESLEHDPDVDVAPLEGLRLEADRADGQPVPVAVCNDADGGVRVGLPDDATLVVDVPPAATAEDAASKSTLLEPLPVAASSLGAVALDGHLYAYGGHVAPVHTYSTEAVSGRFQRLALAGPATWQSLPGGPGLQGMNLAAHGGRIVRVGGMAPRNPPGAEADNHSTASAARYDPETGRWEPLPDLPEPRSSHDVAVIGDTLYVVGGWNMRGDHGETWFDSMVTLDLSDPTRAAEVAGSGRWKTVPQPFRRRALIAAAHRERLWVIGGFTDDEEMSLAVDVFDPATGEWSRGPDLPGPDRNGFSPAACAAGGRLFVSVADGSLFALNDTDRDWRPVGRAGPRIVHRMVPDGTTAVILVGGAAGRENLATVERLSID